MHLARWHDLDFEQKPGRTAADPLRGYDAGEATVRLVRVAAGARSAHVHPHCIEVIHVLHGTGWHHQGEDCAAVSEGDTVVVPAGAPHATVTTERLTLVCFFPHSDPFSTTVELPQVYSPGYAEEGEGSQ